MVPLEFPHTSNSKSYMVPIPDPTRGMLGGAVVGGTEVGAGVAFRGLKNMNTTTTAATTMARVIASTSHVITQHIIHLS